MNGRDRVPGSFIVSLDFELYWGVRDLVSLDECRGRILAAREAIPRILALFSRYGIRATWATVGMIFARNRAHLESCLPTQLPTYEDPSLSPYEHVKRIGRSEDDDPCHYAPSLVERILSTPGQEVGTHTFSHYYCLEPGQTPEQFEADLSAAARISAGLAPTCRSLVFPRNQFNARYLGVMRKMGVSAYRSSGTHWAYRARAGARDSSARRLFRLVDTYLPASGVGARSIGGASRPVDVPASAFLRPLSGLTHRLASAQFGRVSWGMSRAAASGRAYHLWWHPENFGARTEDNLAFLDRILQHFNRLRQRYAFESLAMSEVVGRTASA